MLNPDVDGYAIYNPK